MRPASAVPDVHAGAVLRDLQGLPSRSGVCADLRDLVQAAVAAKRVLHEAAHPRMAVTIGVPLPRRGLPGRLRREMSFPPGAPPTHATRPCPPAGPCCLW